MSCLPHVIIWHNPATRGTFVRSFALGISIIHNFISFSTSVGDPCNLSRIVGDPCPPG